MCTCCVRVLVERSNSAVDNDVDGDDNPDAHCLWRFAVAFRLKVCVSVSLCVQCEAFGANVRTLVRSVRPMSVACDTGCPKFLKMMLLPNLWRSHNVPICVRALRGRPQTVETLRFRVTAIMANEPDYGKRNCRRHQHVNGSSWFYRWPPVCWEAINKSWIERTNNRVQSVRELDRARIHVRTSYTDVQICTVVYVNVHICGSPQPMRSSGLAAFCLTDLSRTGTNKNTNTFNRVAYIKPVYRLAGVAAAAKPT